MLQVDGANQFASGYTGMGNMPNFGVDPDGQFVITTAVILGVAKAAAIGAAIGGGIYTASVATSSGGFENWRWGQFAGAVGMGALNGALGQVAGIPLADFGHGFGLNLTPNVSFGSEGFSIGANLNLGYKSKFFKAGLTVGANAYQNNYTELSGIEGRIGLMAGFTAGKFQASLSSMAYFSGETSQRTSLFKVGGQNWNVQYENDWHPFLTDNLGVSDGGDRFRSAALKISVKDFSAGFNLFTGDPGLESKYRASGVRTVDGFDTYTDQNGSSPDKFRLGAAYFGYKTYKAGINSEWIRHGIQNYVVHRPQDIPYFKRLNGNINSYYKFGNQNPFSLW